MGKSAYHLLRHFSEYVNDAFLSQLSHTHTHTQQTSFWLCVLLSFGESKWFLYEAMFLLLESFTDCEFRCIHDHRGNQLSESSLCKFASSHCSRHWRGQYIHPNLNISTYCRDVYFGRVEFGSFDLRNDHRKEREERCVSVYASSLYTQQRVSSHNSINNNNIKYTYKNVQRTTYLT